jgi:hypothetical protein
MNSKRSLQNRVRGWFPQEPVLKVSRIQLFIKQSSKPWDLGKNMSNFLYGQLFLGLFIIYLFMVGSINDFLVIIWPCFMVVYIGITVYNLRKYHGLQDIFSGGLFAASIGTVIVGAFLFWLKILSAMNSIILVISSMAVFTLLYAWVQRAGKMGIRLPHKSLAFSLALIGIIALASSLAVVYHIEDRTEVTHQQNIFSEYFRLSRQLPDEVVNISLTTQDHFLVDMTKAQNANLDSSASILFTISDQPLSSNATVYFSANTIDSWYIKSWDVPKNGTYVFTLHFNYIAANYVWVGVTKVWSTIEMIPSEVATPLLAELMIPTIIVAAASLTTSVSIPIQCLKGPNRRGAIKQKWKDTWSQWKRSYF